MEREAGWYAITSRLGLPWQPVEWREGEWWYHGKSLGSEDGTLVGSRIPEPAELAALIALREGIDADDMETVEDQIPEHMLRLRMLLRTWTNLRRAASPAGEEK